MNKNGVVAVVVVITAVVLVGLWVLRSGQTRPGGRRFDCTAPPEPPVNLTYNKTGDVVKGRWSPPPAGEPATHFVIEVGSQPGLNDQGTHVIQVTQTEFGGPTPPGIYFARVFARNACGSSPASNEVTFTVP